MVSGEGIAADGRDHGERADDEPVVWIVEGAQCEHPLKADKLAARQRRGTGWRQPSFDLDR